MSNWDEFSEDKCACGSYSLVLPCGPQSSDVLIIGEFPGDEEIKIGKPFSGPTGGLLREELRRLKLSLSSMRVCNLWLHAPNKEKGCLDYGFQQCIKEAKGRRVVVLIGSDVVKKFCDLPVSEYTGLQVQSPYLSAPIVVACIQPASVFNGVVGEFRLSLQKIAELIEVKDE